MKLKSWSLTIILEEKKCWIKEGIIIEIELQEIRVSIRVMALILFGEIWWKDGRKMYVQSEDYELWNRITDGPTILMKIVDGGQVKKGKKWIYPRRSYCTKKNSKAKNIRIWGLRPAEYNRASNCTTAK